MENDDFIVVEGIHKNPNNFDTIDESTKIIHGPFKKEDESVKQNLIMHSYKICNSCNLAKTIFPI